MDTATARELILKISTGTYTDEELASFLEAVKTMDKPAFMAAYQLLYEEINKYPPEELAPGFKDRLERRLDVRDKTVPFRRKWWSYAGAAAAAVLVFFVAGHLLLTPPKKQLPIAEQPVKKDIPAGRQGAILTLSNGRQIVLDSAANGVLTRDAGVQVIRRGGELSYGGNADEVLYNKVVTPRGRKWQLTLSDGTKVWLNAASSVRYPLSFVGRERLVEVSGETYFEVAPDKNRPFRINIAGKGKIEVLGTHLNVNAYDDEDAIRTTLLEGSIKVIRGGSSSLLSPGQQAVLFNGKEDIKVINDANIDEVMAWRKGRFIFSDMDLKTIMRQLTRWYDVDVVYEGKVPEIRVGGIIHNDVYLSTVMEFLGENGVHYQIEGKKIIIMP
ncbi:MAG TPA: FecR domain-containing protein [Puia sp.]|nr:FecR domain-containing protein [Puia sp.]